MRHLLRFFAALSIVMATTGFASAAKIGPEFLVNPKAINSSVAGLNGGGFVVVWRWDNAPYPILGQRYNANGVKVGGAFSVAAAAPEQVTPFVTRLAGGGFVVVWHSPDANGLGVFLQRFSANGTKIGGRIRANTYSLYDQSDPTAAGLTNGTFVVAWSSVGQGGSTSAVYAQRFSAGGVKLGTEFRVDTTFPTGFHQFPSVAALAGGGFAVVYRGYNGTYMRRFNATGGGLGQDVQVNAVNEGLLQRPVVAGLNNGGFVVVREVSDIYGDLDVFGQRYNSAGAKVGGAFRVNAVKANAQFDPAVAALTNGGFIVVFAAGTSTHFARGRLYGPGGAAFGLDFPLNTSVIPIDARPSVAPLTFARFVATWQGSAPGAIFAVRAQRFSYN
jgi:hypothetical protein